jgi:hypothetical protein
MTEDGEVKLGLTLRKERRYVSENRVDVSKILVLKLIQVGVWYQRSFRLSIRC